MKALEPVMLEDYCTPEKAQALADRVLACRRVIESYNNGEPNFRFGAEMQAQQPGFNMEDILPFKPDFEELRLWLEQRFNAKVDYHPRMPLPGFHVFQQSAEDGGKPHADGQAFSAANYIDSTFLSAWTIVVGLQMPPRGGGGIHFWRKTLVEVSRERGHIDNPMPHYDYTVKLEPGKILMFDASRVHQIEGFEINSLKEARVTLVAHLGEIEPGRYIFFFDRLKNVRDYYGIEFEPRVPKSP